MASLSHGLLGRGEVEEKMPSPFTGFRNSNRFRRFAPVGREQFLANGVLVDCEYNRSRI